MSSKFENALKSTLNDEVSITENGACGFKTSSSKLLDINFAVSSLRNRSDAEVEKMFVEAYQESPLLALKWLFMARDIRGGMGERRLFRVCFKWISRFHYDVAVKLIPLVAEYGRFDDLFAFDDDDNIWNEVFVYVSNQWKQDIENMNANKSISLLPKWMPSVNTSSKKSVALAKRFCKELNLSEKQYRKTLSALRKYLNVIEQKMSSKEWKAINYEQVPSKANIKYNAAFLRNDENRRREFLNSLNKGEAKINSSACFPSDIVHQYSSRNYGDTIAPNPALEAMWKSLPEVNISGNLICCCDGSGSMGIRVDRKSSVTALEVCNALGIYCSEHLTGPFKDKYITFSERPQFVDMSNAKSLAEKLNIAYAHDECANTNIEAVMDLILETAIRNNLKQEDIPDLCILSDMEFDQGVDVGCSYGYFTSGKYLAAKNALFEKIRRKWEKAGYKLVRIIFWNIASRSGTIPLQQNENGVVLCSGFSQSTFKMIQSNKTDPYEVLIESLNVERYAPVENAIKDII